MGLIGPAGRAQRHALGRSVYGGQEHIFQTADGRLESAELRGGLQRRLHDLAAWIRAPVRNAHAVAGALLIRDGDPAPLQRSHERRGRVARLDFELRARRRAERRDAALRRELALPHYDYGVAGALYVRQEVRRDDDVDPFAMRDAPDQLQHVVAALRVQAVRRLVE